MSDLKGKTLFITGASRGIGLAIGRRAARDSANIVIAAKTTEPLRCCSRQPPSTRLFSLDRMYAETRIHSI